MAFEMKGPSLYRELKINRKIDHSSIEDGRAKSSAFQKKGEDKTAARDKIVNSITADMTDKQLRNIAVNHNAGKASKDNISFAHLKSLRNQKAKYKNK
jgi:hypothetical protein